MRGDAREQGRQFRGEMGEELGLCGVEGGFGEEVEVLGRALASPYSNTSASTSTSANRALKEWQRGMLERRYLEGGS